MIARKGRIFITKIVHGSPAHVSGRIAVGDEVVSIDGFPVNTDNVKQFAIRAAAGGDNMQAVLLRHSSISGHCLCDKVHAFALLILCASSGAKDSLVKMGLKHPHSRDDPDCIHEVIVQRTEIFESGKQPGLSIFCK